MLLLPADGAFGDLSDPADQRGKLGGYRRWYHKFYGIKNEDGVKKGTVISTLFCPDYRGRRLLYRFTFPDLFTEVPTLDGKANYDLIVHQILANFAVILFGVVLVLVV